MMVSRGVGCRKEVDVSPVNAWRGLAVAVLCLVLISVRAFADDVTNGTPAAPKRPAALVPLYVGFGALQALDAHSTLTSMSNGAYEVNPLMRGAAASPTAVLAVKAATAAGVVALTERLWRHNRTAAVLTMVGLNSAYAAMVVHNYGAGR
jgi:hypothetical protein